MRRSLRMCSATFWVSRRFIIAPTAAPIMNGIRFGRVRIVRFMICWRSSRFIRPVSAELSVAGLVRSTPRSSVHAVR